MGSRLLPKLHADLRCSGPAGTEPWERCAVGGGRLQQSWSHVTGNLTHLELIPPAQLAPLNKVYSVLLNAPAVPVPGECSAQRVRPLPPELFGGC